MLKHQISERIIAEFTFVDGIEYIPAPKGFYQEFFNNKIGVTHEENAKVEKLKVMRPQSLREQIKEIVAQQIEEYSHD